MKPGAVHLREDLDLEDGLGSELAIQFGFDASIDADLLRPGDPGSRLTDNLNEGELGPSDATFPSQIFVQLNDGPPCPRDASFHVCFENRARAQIRRLIRLGTFAEDNPNPRARHHFHDPSRPHPPPAGNHGLDDGFRLRRGLDRVLADVATRLLGRGPDRRRSWLRYLTDFFLPDAGIDPRDFDLRGRSAVDRALNRPIGSSFPSDRSPRNRFALPDAERYLHLALTSRFPDERQHWMALHFLAFGHVLHLLQDMGSVAHVRNDFLLEHVLVPKGLAWINLEDAADWPAGGRRFRTGLSVANEIRRSGAASLPQQFLAAHSTGTFDSLAYRTDLGLVPQPVLEQFDVGDFWDEPPLDVAGLDGLAEVVQRNFFSTGSVSNSAVKNGYPRPFVADCQDPTSTLGTGDERVWIADLPERRLLDGDRQGAQTLPYLSSSRVPHLGRCRLHCLIPVASLLRPGLCGTRQASKKAKPS